jgi:PilZ domain-containing protein
MPSRDGAPAAEPPAPHARRVGVRPGHEAVAAMATDAHLATSRSCARRIRWLPFGTVMRNEQPGPGRAAAKGDNERRSSARLPVEMWVEELTDGSQVFRRAGNLSRGGMHLDHTIPTPLGTRVRLRFTLPGDNVPVVVTAEIVSIATSHVLGMGVKFIDVEPTVQNRIDGYLLRALTPVP